MKTPAGDALDALMRTSPSDVRSTGHARPEKSRSRLDVAIAYDGAARVPVPEVRYPDASRWVRSAHIRKPPPARSPSVINASTLPMTTSTTAPTRDGRVPGVTGGGAHWVVI